MKIGSIHIFILCLVFLMPVERVIGKDVVDVQTYFSADQEILKQIEQRIGHLSPGNAEETLDFANRILLDYPNLLVAHILQAHTLYHGTGKVNIANEKYQYIQDVCNRLIESEEIAAEYSREIDDLLFQVRDIAIPMIQRDFAPLRFKIRNKNINKFCHIRNMKVLIAYDEAIYTYANDDQKLRLDYLKESLESGEMKFQISAYDSTDNRYYFEIPFFPLIDAPGVNFPYAIILNNQKRYHFKINRQFNKTVEINWNDDWELVESVPQDLIKFEFPDSYSLRPVSIADKTELQGTFSIPEYGLNLENLYVPTVKEKELALILEQDTKAKYISRIFVHTTRVLITGFILWTFILIRA